MSMKDIIIEEKLADAMRQIHESADICEVKLSKSGKNYIVSAHYGYDFDCPDPQFCIPKEFAEALIGGVA